MAEAEACEAVDDSPVRINLGRNTSNAVPFYYEEDRTSGPFCPYCGQECRKPVDVGADQPVFTPKTLLEAFELPIEVRVVKGWCAADESQSLGEGDVITIFYARNEKIVKGRDRGKREVVIPCNTGMEFYLLDNDAVRSGQTHLGGVPLLDRAYTMAEILTDFELPMGVRFKSQAETTSRSSAHALTLFEVCKQETLIGGNDRMHDLVSLPTDLDIELVPTDIYAARQRHSAQSLYQENRFFESLIDVSEIRGVGNRRLSRSASVTSLPRSKDAEEKLRKAETRTLEAVELAAKYQKLYENAARELNGYRAPRRKSSTADDMSVLDAQEKQRGLSVDDVGDLLRRLELPEHVDRFAAERVDGKLLVQLDDESLRDELRVKSRLHRLRILGAVFD